VEFDLQPIRRPVFPVNPKRANVLGVKAYPSVTAIPEEVDLAVVVTPPPTIPGIIRECGENGVKGAVVISAGFKEIGPEGAALEQQVLEEARKAKIRVIGPNCLGVMAPLTGLNATFSTTIARPGVGFISQSGALCTAVLDWSLKEMVGFSAFVSVGSMVDVGWGDLIYHLGNDPKTRSIVNLHGDHRQCAVIPLGCPRSRPDQTDHCHQSRPHRRRRQSGRFAHRFP
jgi:acetyltransferase